MSADAAKECGDAIRGFRLPDLPVVIYLHTTKDRDRAIADALGEIVKEGLKSDKRGTESLPAATPNA
ncbi:hypothetical protein [Streptosporangium sp. V21-05]|uniref:hypothetical protein n=1 Tax=Streptosporangium sp. V21-05 TaxID=3446115 RepID=UPI003F53A6D8